MSQRSGGVIGAVGEMEEDEQNSEKLFGPCEEDRKTEEEADKGVDDEEDDEEEMEKGVQAKPAMTPNQPSKKEVDDHELTHVEFRNWCVHCQRGKAANNPHKRRWNNGKKEIEALHEHPTISIDYMFMEADYRDKGKEHYERETKGKRPILVVHDSKTSAMFAHDMKEKGASEDTIGQLEEDIRDMGYQGVTIILKGDQEPSIKAIQETISRRRNDGRTVPENSPVGESSANGAVERAIRSVQGQIRTIKDNVEAKTGEAMLRDSGTFKWLVEWSAATLTRYRITSNGRTSYAMIKGRQSRAQIAGFAEKILYMPLRSSKVGRSKLEPRMEYGVFYGVNFRTDEVRVGTERGVVKARTIKRLAPEDRWDGDYILKIKGRPTQPVPGVKSHHIPIQIHEDGSQVQQKDEDKAECEAG